MDPSLLTRASFTGDLVEVRRIVSSGADINARDDNGESPLTSACAQGHMQIVEYLLEQGAQPEPSLEDRGKFETPLIVAMTHGHFDVADILIAAGADPLYAVDRYHAKIQKSDETPARTGFFRKVILGIKHRISKESEN